MSGFSLLLGHLVGDYIVQNDWMAANKVNPNPGRAPDDVARSSFCDGSVVGTEEGCRPEGIARLVQWEARSVAWELGHVACTVHCLLYTLSVWAFSFWWMPWWGLLACFVIHWPVDRFRLAKWWMVNISGQSAFATGPLSPWSFILVDNIFHLLTLFVIALLAGA